MALEIVWRNPVLFVTASQRVQRIESVQLELVYEATAPDLAEGPLSYQTSEAGLLFQERPHVEDSESLKEQAVFTLSGQMEEEPAAELEPVINAETSARPAILDLENPNLAGWKSCWFSRALQAGWHHIGKLLWICPQVDHEARSLAR